MTDVHSPGYPRSYFYARIAGAMREILDRHQYEEYQPEMVTKVNVQDSLNRLVHCPVCGAGLKAYEGYPLERACECGDFTITQVYSDGDVVFEFKMVAPEKLAAEKKAAEEGLQHGS